MGQIVVDGLLRRVEVDLADFGNRSLRIGRAGPQRLQRHETM